MEKLLKLNIDPKTITISGFSAGGFLASQMHFVYSSRFSGVGLISGGPFSYFADRNKFKGAEHVKVENLIRNTYKFEKEGLIEPTKNIENKKVYIQFGEKDKVLAPGVTEKANKFYEHFKADIKYVRDKDGGHTFTTDLSELCPEGGFSAVEYKARKKVDDTKQKFPYIDNTGFDTAGSLLNYLYPSLNQR